MIDDPAYEMELREKEEGVSIDDYGVENDTNGVDEDVSAEE